MLSTLIIFLVILGILIFVHEFGHFYVARKSGMKVDEFGFGFPPRMFGLQKIDGKWKIIWGHKPPLDSEQTVYSINWIPLGGFVKIVGENNEREDDPRSFVNRPFWGRLATLVAGVSMNFILAWLLISIALVIGMPVGIDSLSDLPSHAILKDHRLIAYEVLNDKPAAIAGMKVGDVLLSVDGQKFEDSEQARNYIKSNPGKVFNFEIARGGENLSLSVPSLANPGPDEGPTGIGLLSQGKLTFPWYQVPWQGAKLFWDQTSAITVGLYQLVSGKVELNNLGGPVKIAQLTGEVSRMGFIYLLQFTAFLSINLGILNILPIPALDGGRVLFLLVEKVRGKRNNANLEQWVNTVGFVLLITLMVLVTAHDISGLGGIGNIFSKLFGG